MGLVAKWPVKNLHTYTNIRGYAVEGWREIPIKEEDVEYFKKLGFRILRTELTDKDRTSADEKKGKK